MLQDASNIFLFRTTADGQGIILAQAQALEHYSKPVTTIGGLQNVMPPNKNGRLQQQSHQHVRVFYFTLPTIYFVPSASSSRLTFQCVLSHHAPMACHHDKQSITRRRTTTPAWQGWQAYVRREICGTTHDNNKNIIRKIARPISDRAPRPYRK